MPVNTDALIQMMAGVGAGLNQQPWTQALNQMVQSGYSSKNQFDLMGLFKQILGGEMPEGKASIGKDGINLKLPATAGLVSQAFGGGEGKMGAPDSGQALDPGKYSLGTQVPNVQTPTMPNLPNQQTGTMMNLLNPSVSQSGISAADLIGLTPQDVSSALSGALNVEKLMMDKVSQPIENFYRSALATESLARAKKYNELDSLDRPFINSSITGDPLTLREFKSMPEGDRTYELYSHSMIRQGKVPLSRQEFDRMDPTDQIKTLSQLQEDPELKKLWLEGKTAATKAAAEVDRTKPDRVTWTTATKELTKRFGKLDPTGMWAVTPELQATHRLAQHILTEAKAQGMESLEAINYAEDTARKRYRRYQQYVEAANTQIKDERRRAEKINEINRQFDQYIESYGR